MTCSPIDFFCVIRDDLVGNGPLAILFVMILYFIIASKLRFGFDTTFMLLVPFLLIISLVIGQIYPIAGFITFFVGAFLGFILVRFFELR